MSEKPNFEGFEASAKWKAHLSETVKGGYDLRKHPQLIKKAIKNATANHTETGNIPDVACSEVFKLGNVIYPFVKESLDKV